MAYADGELEGVGGWLAFFLVTLGVFTPIGTLFSVYQLSQITSFDPSMDQMFRSVVLAEWVMAALICLAAWHAAARFLMVRRWSTVLIAIGTLWLITLTALLIEPLVASWISGFPVSQLMVAEGPMTFIRPIVYSTIWTAYLLNSERVANTYRPSGEEESQTLEDVFE